tara:strand:+ start:5243 stop:6262 length:1020 start_codon:yes stop_codon:yes gene_type:complete
MRFLVLILFSSLLPLSCDRSTNEMASLDPFEQNVKLGRGINLGNTLEGPAEGDWGMEIQEEWFSLVKGAGFNSIRIPIRWSAHTFNEAPYTIDEAFFEQIDWVIEQALLNNLMVIINMHHYKELFVAPAQETQKFLSIWGQISLRYKDQPREVLFEILNEPNGALTAELWNELLPKALDKIRATNQNRTVVIGAAEWGGVPGLLKLDIPEDENLIVTVHYYQPFQFTHQGAGWVKADADAWLGTTWDGAPEEVAAVENHFQTIVDWGKERNVPINIGEFGAFSKADSESRARWTEAIVRFALENNMSYHYWEFASGFGIFNPNTGAWDQELLRALTETE